MAHKPVSRASRDPVNENEIDRMVELFLELKSFKAVGKRMGRHWQTVSKYATQALKERQGEELRKEALKQALTDHFNDLVSVLPTILNLMPLPDESCLEISEWNLVEPDRRTRLLLEALKESHAQDSPVWSLWHEYIGARMRYQDAVGELKEKIEADLEILLNNCPESKIKATGELSQILGKRAISISRMAPVYDPSLIMMKTVGNRDGGEPENELWLGQSILLAESDNDISGVKDSLSNLMEHMNKWPEVETLTVLFEKLAGIRDKIEEEIEVLSLRRAFPGKCRLCPV